MSQDAINDFRGENEYLTNFYPSIVVVDNEAYPTVEHAFQAAKTDDLTLKAKIRSASTAREAKKIGSTVPLIQDWDQKRLDVMASLVNQKFTEHLDLKLRLLATGNRELIQGNTYKDRFWGQDQSGVGENHLGKILMAVRAQIRAAEGTSLQVLVKFLQDRKLNDMTSKLEALVKFAETCSTVADYDSSGICTCIVQHKDVDDIKSVLASLS